MTKIFRMSVRALRGATTIDRDSREEIITRTKELLGEMFLRNEVDKDQLISILFTGTPDVHGAFPAAAARELGYGDVPLMCAQELSIDGGTPLCIRVMAHIETTKARDELRHVYLWGAKGLRDDLPA
ncbi:chorismate mutase [Acidithrix ferrooxidans]|nr:MULTISPECIES: chorismate mutase [Acidithrix]